MPSTVAADAMHSVTTGVAMPSLRPLSTLRTRRTRAGRRWSAITAALRAASVGAREAPISPASASGMLGNTSTASTVPATIDSGRPTPSRRPVSGRSRRAAISGTLDASANSSSAEGQFGEDVDRGALDIDRDETPVRVAEQQPCEQEQEWAGDVAAGQALGEDRPPEQDDRDRHQRR